MYWLATAALALAASLTQAGSGPAAQSAREREAEEREHGWASSEDPAVRERLIRELRSIYPDVSAGFLISRLTFEPRPTDITEAALVSITRRTSLPDRAELGRLAVDRNPAARAFAIVALARDADATALIAHLEKPENVDVKHPCLAALAGYRGTPALEILAKYLAAPEPATRGTAAEALALQDWEGARKLLKSRLEQRDLQLYVYRAYLGVRPPDDEVLQAARGTLSMPFPVGGLHQVPLQTDLGQLVPRSWGAAADLVESLKDPAGRQVLENWAVTLDPADLKNRTPAEVEISVHAAGRLARMGDSKALQRLSRVLSVNLAPTARVLNDFGDRFVEVDRTYGTIVAALAQRACEAVLDRRFKTPKELAEWLASTQDRLRWDPQRSIFRQD